MSISRQTIRLAARSVTRHRGFAAIAVLSLGLAIALNTTMYSVIDALVSPKIDMRDPGQLYFLKIWGDYKGTVDHATRAALLRSGFRTYEAVTLYEPVGHGPVAIEYDRRFQQGPAMVVAPNFFRVLGVHPLHGRSFVDSDVTAESQPVLISEQLAAGLSPDRPFPIGGVVDVDGVPHPVIGVIGRASQFPGGQTAIWMPPTSGEALAAIPSNIVRLRPGETPGTADHELSVLSNRLAELAGDDPKLTRFQLIPAAVSQFHFRNFHYALIAAVLAVLFVACANLANLQLARGIGRSRELALRAALGASRRDIIGQLMVESGLLAVAGLVLGLVLTFWGTHLLASRIPPSVGEYVVAPQISWRVFAFAIAACVACVMLVGLVPAVRVSRVDPNTLLKAGAGTGANTSNRRQYGVMIVAEIGLSLALLSGAAIVVRSAGYYRSVDPGFDFKPLTAAWMLVRPEKDTTLRYAALSETVLSRVRALPGVDEATTSMYAPVDKDAVTVEDPGRGSREIEAPMYGYHVVSSSYMRTYRLSIVKGRDFSSASSSEPEVIIDPATARVLFPNSDPIGAQLKLGEFKSLRPWARVVGVVGASSGAPNKFPLTQTKASRLGTIYYLPSADDSLTLRHWGMTFDIIVRSSGDPARTAITLRRSLQRLGPLSVLSAQSMEAQLGILRQRQSHDFIAATFLTFALMAVGLAALGIYGIVTHSVAERRREIGVRIALGASARHVLSVILREGNVLALAGIAVGLWCTKETVEWLRAFSFEEDQYDAPLFASMAVVLFVVAVVAALLPALRATRIDPVESMRSE